MGVSVTFHGMRGVWGVRVSWWSKGLGVSVRVEDHRMSDIGVACTNCLSGVCLYLF